MSPCASHPACVIQTQPDFRTFFSPPNMAPKGSEKDLRTASKINADQTLKSNLLTAEERKRRLSQPTLRDTNKLAISTYERPCIPKSDSQGHDKKRIQLASNGCSLCRK